MKMPNLSPRIQGALVAALLFLLGTVAGSLWHAKSPTTSPAHMLMGATAVNWCGPQVTQVNVVNCMAVDNTGVADAGAQIDAAIAKLVASSASGQTAFLPRGTYLATTALSNLSNVPILAANGVVFTGANAASFSGAVQWAPVVAAPQKNAMGTQYLTPYGEPDVLLDFVAPAYGVYNSLTAQDGTVIQVSRASSATLLAGGVETTASSGQARVNEDGLLLEPAATNGFLDPTNLTTANWTAGGVTVTSGATDPLGGTTAFALTETTANSAHQIYQLITIPASPTSQSIYVKPFGGRTGFRIASNSSADYASFDFTAVPGFVTNLWGTGTGEIEYVGGGWWRITLQMDASTALISLAIGSTSSTFIYAGSTSAGVYAWRPQSEGNPYATTWTATSRAQETAVVTSQNIGPEWAFEATVTPAGAQGWVRGAYNPIVGINVYGANNSMIGYGTVTTGDGEAVTAIYDPFATLRSSNGGSIASSPTSGSGASAYVGQRRITFSANGVTRPMTYYDGTQNTQTIVGDGGAYLNDLAVSRLYLGSDSQPVTGGYSIRELRVVNQNKPPRRPMGASRYSWQFMRGYCPPAQEVAFLGDSLTQGVYDSSITMPYPQGAATDKGTTWQAHNYGIGSNGSYQALQRFRADIRGRGYHEMVVWIGINDVNSGVPSANTIANLTTIYAEALADGITVRPVTLIAGGFTIGSTQDLALTAINAFINASGLTVIDAYTTFSVFSGGVWKMNPADDIDGGSLHLNQTGQTAMATLTAAAL